MAASAYNYRNLLSGSTSGKPIAVANVGTPGTLVHTAVGGSLQLDEVYLWAANVTPTPAVLTIEWGGTGNPTDHVCTALSIPANSRPIPLLTGLHLNGGLVVGAFSPSANAINLTGYANRIATSQVITRAKLSGSTSGRTIPIAATGTPGTLLHTATALAGGFDEIYLWVNNVTAAPVLLTIEWGGTADPTNHSVKQLSIPANSRPIPVMTGQVLNGGLICRAFASVANALNVTGHVNNIF